MKKLRIVAVAVTAALVIAPVAQASIISVLNSEVVTFTNVNSNDGQGSAANETRSHTFTSGFTATHITVEGTLTEVQTGTWASEADILLSIPQIPPPNLDVIANGSTTTTYTGTINTGPTLTELASPTTFAGNVDMEFFESFDDAAGTDQTWDTVTVGFQEIAVVDGNFAMGTLPEGPTVEGPGAEGNPFHSMVAGGLDFFTFSLGADILPQGFLNIQTFDALTGDTMDSEIALFDSAGVLVAFDDDGQVSGKGGLYSLLSFGADPDPGDATAGEDGATLSAGDYTLVVGGFDTNFEDLTIGSSVIGDVTAGTSAGDYQVSFRFQSVPEPGSVLFLGAFGLVLLRRRKRA